MALTTTTLSGTIAVGDRRIKVTAFTNPQSTGISAKCLLMFATGERCLVTAVNSTTLDVVRGYDGTQAAAHTTGEGVKYGLVSDTGWSTGPIFPPFVNPQLNIGAQEITITGSTGSDAATVTVAPIAFLNATGTSGAGLNLPVPTVGMQYWVKNGTTGVCKVYCVGGTINGATGTTAISISATGNLGAGFQCATAGAWQVVPAAT